MRRTYKVLFISGTAERTRRTLEIKFMFSFSLRHLLGIFLAPIGNLSWRYVPKCLWIFMWISRYFLSNLTQIIS